VLFVVVDVFEVCVLDFAILIYYNACSPLYRRLFCFTYQIHLALQHGGVYLVTID